MSIASTLHLLEIMQRNYKCKETPDPGVSYVNDMIVYLADNLKIKDVTFRRSHKSYPYGKH